MPQNPTQTDALITGLTLIRDLAKDYHGRHAEVLIELDNLNLKVGNFADELPQAVNDKLSELGFKVNMDGQSWHYWLDTVSDD
jgi:hypothetical protein